MHRKTPTNAEYRQTLQTTLEAADIDSVKTRELQQAAAAEQLTNGFRPAADVPNTPDSMNLK